MHKKLLFFITIAAFAWNGCDVIDKNDRITEIEGVVPAKKILLLDFTDQSCVNCLKAAEEIKNLIGIYKDTLIAVSIHASDRKFPLVTEEGNKYEEYFKIEVHPTGIIDGIFSSEKPQLWGGIVLKRFQTETSFDLNLFVSYEETKRELNVTSQIKSLQNHSRAKLLLWVIEDKINGLQLMPDGKYINDYEHNHVFRAAINDTFGEAFTIEENEEKDIINKAYVLNNQWETDNISIVGFVYNTSTDEVLSVTEVKLKPENNEINE
ncbi:MAG: hypothetical protein EZS26_001599 [Candidatus Ordinivivax streblomastigis]|uniref:Outer membrane protein Omp28 n=1 Tax=Candidatus Ordinivivax streblomastigis TaxID=2540710 RepID=A0A5M8P1C9_9BACT|nr:MAG: hypothetical protein EZS26_001599 [Candidatus Ordinivivax streblomastigis]